MKKYIYKIGLLAIVATAFLISCDEDTVMYNGENFVSLATPINTDLRINEDVGTAVMPVNLAFAVSHDVTVTYTVTSTIAQAGVDFIVTSTSVVIPAGQVTANIQFTIVDNDVLDDSKPIDVKLTSISDTGISLGIADEGSIHKVGLIVNNDCTTKFQIWFGALRVNESGTITNTTGGVNEAGDCNVLVVKGDIFGFGAEDDLDIPISFSPASDGATNGTVTISDQLYCTACNAGLNINITGSGTYDEVTKVISIDYDIRRSDGATAGGTVLISPVN